MLCVKGNGFVCFYDWENGALVRRIEVDAESVRKADIGNSIDADWLDAGILVT